MISLLININFTLTLVITASLKYLEYEQIHILKWYLLGSFLLLACHYLYCSLKYYKKQLKCDFQMELFYKNMQELRKQEGRSDHGRYRTVSPIRNVHHEAEHSLKKQIQKPSHILTHGKVCRDDFSHSYAHDP